MGWIYQGDISISMRFINATVFKINVSAKFITEKLTFIVLNR